MSAEPSPLSLGPAQVPPSSTALPTESPSLRRASSPAISSADGSLPTLAPAVGPPPRASLATDPIQRLWPSFELYQKHLSILSDYLRKRPVELSSFKVIAVGGLDHASVQGVIAYLQRQIQDIGCQVLNFRETQGRPASHLGHKVRAWGAIWGSIVAPKTCLCPVPEGPCVYIIPFTPLMATQRAAFCLPNSNDNDEQYRWLAHHWDGYARPDVTVEIHDEDTFLQHGEVIKLQPCGMRTILMKRGQGGEGAFTAKQLRRVAFECVEWLRGD